MKAHTRGIAATRWIGSLAAGTWLGLAATASAATFVVDSAVDAADFGLNGVCSAIVGMTPGFPTPVFHFGCTLRSALQEANDLPGEDTIQLPAGTYVLAVASGSLDDSYGDLDVTDDVVIEGAGSTTTTIDGSELPTALNEAVIEVSDPVAGGPYVHLELRGVTIADSPTDGLLTNLFTSFELDEVAILRSGGYGIRRYGTNDLVSRSRIAGGTLAGVFSLGGTLQIIDSVVEDNAAGVLGLTGELEVVDSTIRHNIGGSDGGIRSQGSGLRVQGSTIADNHSTTGGGGIRIEGSDNLILSSTLSGNSSDSDGGAIATYGIVTIVNSTISGNQAHGDGGGIFAAGSPATVRLQNSTVVGNAADADADGAGQGGGIAQDYASTILVRDSLLASNTGAAGAGSDCAGTITSEGYNVVAIDDCGGFSPGAADLEGSPASPLDVQIGPLADNGGPTLTHLPAGTSPAVDRGAPSGCPVDDDGDDATPTVALLIDQRGALRPFDGDGDSFARCDVGAVEVPEPGAAGAAAGLVALGFVARRRRGCRVQPAR